MLLVVCSLSVCCCCSYGDVHRCAWSLLGVCRLLLFVLCVGGLSLRLVSLFIVCCLLGVIFGWCSVRVVLVDCGWVLVVVCSCCVVCCLFVVRGLCGVVVACWSLVVVVVMCCVLVIVICALMLFVVC